MSEWSKLHAKITESEAGAPSFDAAFPEGPSEWDLVGPDSLEYQSLEGDWLLSPTVRAQSGVSSTYRTANGIRLERMVGQDNPDVSLSGHCQSAPPLCTDHTPRTFCSYSMPLSETPSSEREAVKGVLGRGLNDRVMGGNTDTETASIPAPHPMEYKMHPHYWAGGRTYWWKQRFVEIAAPNDRDHDSNDISQVLKEEWYAGDENGLPIGEGKQK